MEQNFRDISRKNYIPIGDKTSLEEINTGCLQRIADAVELASKNYQNLINERDFYKQQYKNATDRAEFHKKSASTYKGKYNNLKKKIDNNQKGKQ